MKEIKEKPTERAPKSDSAGKIPKAALKKAWTETKEKVEQNCGKVPLRKEMATIPRPTTPAGW